MKTKKPYKYSKYYHIYYRSHTQYLLFCVIIHSRMSRKPLPDLLKGIAVILMIQVHIMELFMLPVVYESLFGRISLFLGGVPAAPIFMAVMGYFVALSTKTNKQHVYRGLKLILLGFILNIGLNAHLLILIIKGTMDIDPLSYIFGVDILFLAGLSLIFIALIKHYAGKNLWIFLAFTFIIPLLAEFIPFTYGGEGVWQYVTAYVISHVGWSYFPFFPWAGWVLAGFSLALLEQKFSQQALFRKYGTYLVYLSGIPVIAFLPWAIRISTNLHLYYNHGILFFIWGLFFCLLWIMAFRFILEKASGSKVLTYFGWLGRNVTLVYVIQWLIIGNIATAIFRSQPTYMFWVFLAFALLFTSLITLLVSPFLSSKNIRL